MTIDLLLTDTIWLLMEHIWSLLVCFIAWVQMHPSKSLSSLFFHLLPSLLTFPSPSSSSLYLHTSPPLSLSHSFFHLSSFRCQIPQAASRQSLHLLWGWFPVALGWVSVPHPGALITGSQRQQCQCNIRYLAVATGNCGEGKDKHMQPSPKQQVTSELLWCGTLRQPRGRCDRWGGNVCCPQPDSLLAIPSHPNR